jgi:hypothetical protein
MRVGAESASDPAFRHWSERPLPSDYWEDFSAGARGWIANSQSQLPIQKGHALCRGPWIVDANHAPPGAGYLHLLMHIHTLEERLNAPYAREAGMYPDDFLRARGHAFIHGGFSRNLTNLLVRIRARGIMEMRGAEMTVLVQSQPDPQGPRANWVLTGQRFVLQEEWSEQELCLTADPSQWTFLGSRRDLTSLYGYVPLADVLADVNVSFIFVLFPILVEPVVAVADRHQAWAGRDYPVRENLLPEGEIEFDSVWFRYPRTTNSNV